MVVPEEPRVQKSAQMHYKYCRLLIMNFDKTFWKQKSWQSASAGNKKRWIILVIAQISSFTGQKPSTQHEPKSIESPLRRVIEQKLNYTNRQLGEDNSLAYDLEYDSITDLVWILQKHRKNFYFRKIIYFF